MKTKHLLLTAAMLLFTMLTATAQDATNQRLSSKDEIPFGKKMPPPDVRATPGTFSPQVAHLNVKDIFKSGTQHADIKKIKKALDDYRQQLQNDRNSGSIPLRNNGTKNSGTVSSSANSNFHLTKDINTLTESNPSNRSDWYPYTSYAILNQVMYFAANDGMHGSELWRSDGTVAGTYMVKDIEPGVAASNPYEITGANGKIYFSATTLANGQEPWVSDGTASGTHLLMDINPVLPSDAAQFVSLGNKVYFVADMDDYANALWETDGTTAGTKLVKNLGIGPSGFFISQLMSANGLLYFTFISYTTGAYELWRSDGTDAGTYHIGTNDFFYYGFPLQLTNYNNKLYFSADNDGTGSKLWETDGTDAGTTLAPGNNGIAITTNYSFGAAFPIIKNTLYISGYSPASGSGLYTYDASDAKGVTLVKDITPGSEPAIIDEGQMRIVNNTLYFKVTNYNGGMHDELWRSDGDKTSTQVVKKFQPTDFINQLYNGNGLLYYVTNNELIGIELWKVPDTQFGTIPIPAADIFKGPVNSYPNYLTAFKDNLFFGATDELKGNELFMTHNTGFGATVVKDINTVATSGSNAGYYVNAITPLGKNVLFTAFDNSHGTELYKSDGTKGGTKLLNEILPGQDGSNPYDLVTKNNTTWFNAKTSDSDYCLFKTDGTKNGLQKVVPDYNIYTQYNLHDFKVTDKGLVFYGLYNHSTSSYELWRTNGTAAGTFLLSSTLYYFSYYLNVVGNTAFFVAGDAIHGFELWKSDGSIAGTKLVKDINSGIGNSSPKGMFIYKNEVYFAANNGAGPSFWKSDGTEGGTIQLAVIDPWYGSTVFSNERYDFCISNDLLYFSAIDYSNSAGTQFYRTDGTPKGTVVVKDISPDADSYFPVPSYFKDVNSTLFFIGDDGMNGTELWKSDGTTDGTQMVKDITPGIDGSILGSLISYAGKLYFANSGALWSSDGTADGTMPVEDQVISEVNVKNIVVDGDNLYISGDSPGYGIELFEGHIDAATGKLTVSNTTKEAAQSTLPFNAALYPNPVINNATLQLTGNTKNVSVAITDINGKILWQGSINNSKFVRLPTEKYSQGIYFVTVTNGKESKTIKLIK